ncbi:kinesin-like protein KIN-7O isoform X2 [Argentina anserina]|uniref:kinesin-like protein KIN-7O isoform X2 n=1 Tax=Argentina anserina TaxID=57926 RepID=UPI00217675CB|nr:kinesin-like protein KIN-7O isoform X2 [Potentilla anserina]
MERIQVTVRARPLPADDAKTSPWRISGNSIYIPNSSSKFEFDWVFGEDSKTSEVYQSRTKDIVAAAVGGFNGTVFAYGQTNSGKTYTIRGSATEPGVIRLAVRDMFDLIQLDVDREFLLRMSYMEIYNEEINDLLAPEHRKLQIHESIERGIYVAGLREEIVVSPEQVLELMEFGEAHRHIGETNMNLYSSRSHTIFRMIIESRDKTEDEVIGSSCDAVRVSVLNLVDLAGSERAAKTGAEGVRLKEGSHINKSLMTLGTVIKKLSEGAESQGGHVPYRDSKLTRILQPALGGNANTAIICNITLAQIHADETKSSLQFASRALRVTNCAHVNEILTDAALLKRQKKEIEELRAKLQDSHSEHWGEEILNLRNTLLQTESERERIALELEEEKKAQAEKEKMVQQQAKKIENLSSMVLYSNRDENRDHFKKKRRDTWCPGKLAKEALGEVPPTITSKASPLKPTRPKREMQLLPFEELVNETDVAQNESCKDEDYKRSAVEDCILPDPCALLHVTSRRKVPPRTKSLCQDNELLDLQGEYEDLLIKFETQRTCSEIQIDYLTRKLAEADLSSVDVCYDYPTSCVKKGTVDKNISVRESEAIIVIKRLQEQIKRLEMEISSSQQNLDSVVELAKEQNICAMEKFDELHEELLIAQEESRVAREQHSCNTSVTQDDYKTMEAYACEKDSQIISLEKELELYREKEVDLSSNEGVHSEIKSLSEMLNTAHSEVNELQQELLGLRNRFEESKLQQQKMENSIKMLAEEKEELALKLTDSLLEMEEERVIWSSKEKVSLEAIENKSKLYKMEIASNSKEMSEVRNELESCRQECKGLREKLTFYEEATGQKISRLEKILDVDQLHRDHDIFDSPKKQSEELSNSNLELRKVDAFKEENFLQKELSFFKKERDDLLLQMQELSKRPDDLENLNNQLILVKKEKDRLVTEFQEQQKHLTEEKIRLEHNNDLFVEELTRRIASMEVKMHSDHVENGKEKAKLRMRLRGTQAKLDAFCYRYKEAEEEKNLMDRKFKEATANLKDRLALKGVEVLTLKKLLAAKG